MQKLLIVDDNKQITSILEEYAKKEGYETVIALDGEQAIEKFKSEKPDVLLLDVMMPKRMVLLFVEKYAGYLMYQLLWLLLEARISKKSWD